MSTHDYRSPASPDADLELPDPSTAISYGWAKTKENVSLFLSLGLLIGVLGMLEGGARVGPHGGDGLLRVAAQIASMLVVMGFWRAALYVHDGRAVDLGVLREVTLVRFLYYALTTILLGVIVGVGFLLLIVPGVLWALRFSMAPIAVIDEGLDPLSALSRSSELTEGVRGKLFVFGAALIGLNMLGALALGVGLLATMPISYVATAMVFRRLQARAVGRNATPHGPALAGV